MKRINPYLPLAAICLLALGLYAGVLNGEFLGWDDDKNILMNPFFLANDYWGIWRHSFYGLYVPVVYTVWHALYACAGASPIAFHGLNLLLHLANIVMVYSLIARFDRSESKTASLLGAAIFALHPMQIEAVAWISGTRDLLSLFFALLAVSVDLSRTVFSVRRTLICVALFALALLCKPAVIAVPAVLWVYRISRDRASAFRISLEYFGWVLIAIPIFFVTRDTQTQYGAAVLEWWRRPLTVIDAYGFYLGKFFWPFHLSADYGRTPVWMMENLSRILPNALIDLAAIAAAWRWRHWRWGLIGYLILLLPVSGLIPFAYQQISSVADRYASLSFIPLIWGLSLELEDAFRGPTIRALLVASLSAALFAVSIQRVGVWKTNQTFFEAMERDNPRSFSAEINLAGLSQRHGDLNAAQRHVEKALEIYPHYLNAIFAKYVILSHLGKNDEVISYYNGIPPDAKARYRKLEPIEWANFINNVAVSQYQKGLLRESLASVCEAVQTDPTLALARSNLAFLKEKLHADCP